MQWQQKGGADGTEVELKASEIMLGRGKLGAGVRGVKANSEVPS